MPAPIRLMVFEGYTPGYGFYNAFGALQRPLLQRGSRGDAVIEAQQKLMDVLARSLPNGASGTFDADTEAAVRDAQRNAGLAVDGIIGKDTWTLLLGQPVEISGKVIPQDGADPIIDDGDLVIKGAPKAGGNTMLYVGVGAAILAAAILFKGKGSKSKGGKSKVKAPKRTSKRRRRR